MEKDVDLEKYIGERYERWLDNARFWCKRSGLEGEEHDLLNEVLLMLWQKPRDYLEKLFRAKRKHITELDFYVLHMIRTNATSENAPYRFKYRQSPIDAYADPEMMDLEDTPYEEDDQPDRVLEMTQHVRDALHELCRSDLARRAFVRKFFAQENLQHFPEDAPRRELYQLYKRTFQAVRDKLNGSTLF